MQCEVESPGAVPFILPVETSHTANQHSESKVGSGGGLSIGLGGLCWHNFEHNRYQKALSIYAGIIGTFEHNVCERGRLVLVVQTQTAIHDCTEVHITSHYPPASWAHACLGPALRPVAACAQQ